MYIYCLAIYILGCNSMLDKSFLLLLQREHREIIHMTPSIVRKEEKNEATFIKSCSQIILVTIINIYLISINQSTSTYIIGLLIKLLQ